MTAAVAVVTTAHGRHEHLVAQLRGLATGSRHPDLHVVVAMDDPAIAEVTRRHGGTSWPVRVVPVAREDGHLPLARARNIGVTEAMRAGCDRLVMLDVDCIPEAGLVRRYCEVLDLEEALGDGAPVVASGEVAYLPPLPEGADPNDRTWFDRAVPHPARPTLPDDAVSADTETTLFWSLSFAMTAENWCSVGGFDEAYLGYGGEDTDFGQRLARAGGHLLWTGGARALHQHHDVESPPVRHLEDIVRNANLFAARWGWWPMTGWLEHFEDKGLARRDDDGSWRCVSRGRHP